MEDNFVLSEKRSELAQVLRNEFGIHNSKAWLIVGKVVKQDEEFIKLDDKNFKLFLGSKINISEYMKRKQELIGGGNS